MNCIKTVAVAADTTAYAPLLSHLSKYFYHPHPDIILFIMIPKGYQTKHVLRQITKC